MEATPRLRVAWLFQAVDPPIIDGARRNPKPGGYSDSGADMAAALARDSRDVEVVTPVSSPSASVALDWVFPDTHEGIERALALGANVLWANTVLFEGHPLEGVLDRVAVVGQHPAMQQRADDKFATNAALRAAGLDVAVSVLVSSEERADALSVAELSEERLASLGLEMPVVFKPVRGRGSQGVTVVASLEALRASARALFDDGGFGSLAMIEPFLPGDELTITVLPPGAAEAAGPVALRPVARGSHVDGVVPYNGLVAVTHNSRVLTADEARAPAVVAVMVACEHACRLLGARAVVRIDARADANGKFWLFDLNAKPNLTGAGRPGRDDQDSLVTMAASAEGLSYVDLLARLLRGRWREPSSGIFA